ncbi:hypothetical protein OTU49_011357 [Cherax quadricarinatus]|uniref:Prokineticin domain-containing protein n=1 Tax=Cherax quadricarinatus TaxID=27406 RepID=A0AAW0W4Z1_CHEQU|nr:astakine-like [Cherax quadricarinatus]WGF23286.1 astakine 2 [Cherax quadricarinatus]
MMVIVRSVLLVVCVSSMVLSATVFQGTCSSSSACGPSACCKIGYMRYSYPNCHPLGGVGDWCRLEVIVSDRNLHYPNNVTIFIKELYTGMCPCGAGLVCARTSSTCQLPLPDDIDQLTSPDNAVRNNAFDTVEDNSFNEDGDNSYGFF